MPTPTPPLYKEPKIRPRVKPEFCKVVYAVFKTLRIEFSHFLHGKPRKTGSCCCFLKGRYSTKDIFLLPSLHNVFIHLWIPAQISYPFNIHHPTYGGGGESGEYMHFSSVSSLLLFQINKNMFTLHYVAILKWQKYLRISSYVVSLLNNIWVRVEHSLL